MARMTSNEALGRLVGAAEYAGFVTASTFAEGIALVTITMQDGSKFNVQVHKIQSEEDKMERAPTQKNPDFGKKKLRVKRTDEQPPASTG